MDFYLPGSFLLENVRDEIRGSLENEDKDSQRRKRRRMYFSNGLSRDLNELLLGTDLCPAILEILSSKNYLPAYRKKMPSFFFLIFHFFSSLRAIMFYRRSIKCRWPFKIKHCQFIHRPQGGHTATGRLQTLQMFHVKNVLLFYIRNGPRIGLDVK